LTGTSNLQSLRFCLEPLIPILQSTCKDREFIRARFFAKLTRKLLVSFA
jgi:hypothetical protein